MGALTVKSNRIVAALVAAVWFSIPAAAPAGPAELDQLFDQLDDADTRDWQRIEGEILREWSRSGSAAMDLLLQRGRTAMERGDLTAAIEHFTALTDHAPDFAEGWNARATAFYHAGQFGPSIADIQRTLALEPRHFGALAGLGLIFESIGQEDRALEAWRMAQAIHPHSPGINDAVQRLERKVSGTDL
jgi:tetratricopeptide (TPR) repeat protein